MCTYKITVDEVAISKIRPIVTPENFGILLQHYVDELVDELTSHSATPSPNAYAPEEMKSIVAQRIKEMEAGTATYVDGEVGFALIRSRYGL
jgi:hypothetical protein